MWIRVIRLGEAVGRLRRLYESIRSPDGHVDEIMQCHSERPRTLEAHLALYKAVLHNPDVALSPRERELVGSYVSGLNRCDYCRDHHTHGLARHVGDSAGAGGLVAEALGEVSTSELTDRERNMCAYAEKLTRRPGEMELGDVQRLRDAGLTDGEVLDLNQVVAYFAYANRTVLGLGVEAGEEPLGRHPSEVDGDLRHQ